VTSIALSAYSHLCYRLEPIRFDNLRFESRMRLYDRSPAIPFTLFAFASLIAGCNASPVGPSLSGVDVTAPVIQPSAGNPALCCCRVVGSAVNHNDVPVHVTIKYKAFDGVRKDPLVTVLYFIKDFRAGDTQPIDASGILYPCNAVKSVGMEVGVRGIVFPPY
jgi:hypothetical protein